jgi:CRISPR system Cascade subunit CasA
MSEFNLASDPWLPVRWKDGRLTRPLVSLNEAFVEGREIADLSCAPHERVSLIRLLVCITQAALGAPANPNQWSGWGGDLATAVPDYLAKWQDRFNLFGDGPRFLQVKLSRAGEPVPGSKLIPHFATGNNPTPFDHSGGDERPLPPSRLALSLLAFQAFYPLYGAGYKGKGPCVDSNMIHMVLTGKSLHETILLNCLDSETIARNFSAEGRPLWELDPADKATRKAATETYLGRLVPRHRNLMLVDDGTGFHLSKESLEYPTFPAFVEPSATTTIRKKGGTEQPALLPARLDRSLWRDLHVVAALGQAAKDGRNAPLMLQSHATDQAAETMNFWLGALVTDLKAKIHDTLESTFTVPTELFTPEGQQRYEQGTHFAEDVSKKIYGSVKTYSAEMMHESAATDAAQRHFWDALDRQSGTLLALLKDIFSESNPMGHWPFGKRHDDGSHDPWTAAVRQAAEAAYDHVCPRQTPRQLQAYAAGLRVLRRSEAPPTKKKAARTAA